MRQRIWLAAFTTLSLAACSHGAQKQDTAPAPPTVPASTTEAKAATNAKASDTESAQRLTCTSKGETRLLEVRSKDKGCELAYTKGGKESVVANGTHGNAYCLKTQSKIQDKLKASGYECK